MKNRFIILTFFYLVLILFIVYEICYVSKIWQNQKLYKLYENGFYFYLNSNSNIKFEPTSRFVIFTLPLISCFISVIGFFGIASVQWFNFKQIGVKVKNIVSIISFIALMSGFYVSLAAQLFYTHWDNSSVVIIPYKSETNATAQLYFSDWLNLTQIWSIFGLFFILFITSIFFLIKLYAVNVEINECTFKYCGEKYELKNPKINSSGLNCKSHKNRIIKFKINKLNRNLSKTRCIVNSESRLKIKKINQKK